MFIALTKTSVKNPEIFLEAAQAKIQLKAPATEIKVLLDSAVNEAKNSGTMAGPYYLARGDFQAEQGEYRSAIADYNMYDSIAPSWLILHFSMQDTRLRPSCACGSQR